jgi:multimeric flavodoxin WrbA
VGIIEGGAKAAGARSQRFFLSKKKIMPCTGCGSCIKTGICVLASQTKDNKLADDYLELKAALDRTDALALVAPIYFAGPPSQLKALFDRLQPYWAKRYAMGGESKPKRPAQLFIVGGGDAFGHDPHGHEPLVGIARSALAVAGFSLEKIHNFVGFRTGAEKPVLPSQDNLSRALGEIAQLKRAVSQQEDFEQRARDAGGALARFIVWSKTATATATAGEPVTTTTGAAAVVVGATCGRQQASVAAAAVPAPATSAAAGTAPAPAQDTPAAPTPTEQPEA